MLDYLEHHGIPRQKWGVKNGPPYPLDRKTHNRVVKGTSGKSKTKASKKTESTTNTLSSKNSNSTIDKLIASGKARVSNLPDYNVGSLTTMTHDGQSFISGLTDGHDFDWNEISVFDDGTFASAAYDVRDNGSGFGRKSTVSNSALLNCNPDFGSPGTTQNCAKCSAELELAQRGYSCHAGRQSFPSSVDAMSYWFKGAQRVQYDSTDSVQEGLESYGKNTSGTIGIQYATGGGHAMHWTVDNDGTFEIQDGQNGKRFNSVKEMADEYGADTSQGFDTFRLDNCEPDWDAMASDSVVRESSTLTRQSKVANKFSGKVVDTW